MGDGASGGGWEDGWWSSADGLRLHYRDYAGDSTRMPLLCIPGLTRNARDFHALAVRLAPARRVVVIELRGRGLSDRAPDPLTYLPPVYLQDVLHLLDWLAVPRWALFGTSLGGLIAMLLGLVARERLGGVLLNDIGPIVEAGGLARIRSHVGQDTRWHDWNAAAQAQRAVHGHAYPDYGVDHWRAMAKRLCVADRRGGITTDYDPAIAAPFDLPPPEQPVDLWPGLEALRGMPALLVRGALSDILSEATAAEMVHRLPDLDLVTIAATGHAPTLDEPEARAAIDRLLARIDRAR